MTVQNMSRTAMNYTKQRVEEVVQCTNGKISTKLQAKKVREVLSYKEKRKQIRSGEAKLKSDDSLYELEDLGYKPGAETGMDKLFVFQKTKTQKKADIHNKTINNQIEERHTEVELAGKRLVDRASLGIILVESLPEELEELARMADE